MNRTLLLAASLLAFALTLVTGARAAAPTYLERLEAFEKESGAPSRITVYARALALNPPSFDQPSSEKIILSLEFPFQQDLSFLKNYAADYDPCAKLFYEAPAVKEYRHFVYTAPSDPIPNAAALQNVGRYLVLRSQANAKAGKVDDAISDVGALWLAGHSFETTNGSIIGNIAGMTLRNLAVDQMIALIEKYDLTFEQQSRIISLITKQPETPGSQVDTVLADYANQLTAIDARPDAAKDLAKKAVEAMVAVTTPLKGVPFLKQRELLPAYELQRGKSEEVLGKGKVLAIGDLLTRQAIVDAKQAVLLTGLCVSAANKQAKDGKAAPEQIAALAKDFVALATDPFTGKSPRVNNIGGQKFLITSAGPDAVFTEGALQPYKSRMGLVSPGDLYLKRE